MLPYKAFWWIAIVSFYFAMATLVYTAFNVPPPMVLGIVVLIAIVFSFEICWMTTVFPADLGDVV